MFTALVTQELATHSNNGLIGRRIDTILWAITLLHNIETLEVNEEAIRQTEAD
jgi:hypothetical protein